MPKRNRRKAFYELRRRVHGIHHGPCSICSLKLATQMEGFIADPYSRYICAQCAKQLLTKGQARMRLVHSKVQRRLHR